MEQAMTDTSRGIYRVYIAGAEWAWLEPAGTRAAKADYRASPAWSELPFAHEVLGVAWDKWSGQIAAMGNEIAALEDEIEERVALDGDAEEPSPYVATLRARNDAKKRELRQACRRLAQRIDGVHGAVDETVR
jgi:hypothetical protein